MILSVVNSICLLGKIDDSYLKEKIQQEADIIVSNTYNNYDVSEKISFNFFLKNTLIRSLQSAMIKKDNVCNVQEDIRKEILHKQFYFYADNKMTLRNLSLETITTLFNPLILSVVNSVWLKVANGRLNDKYLKEEIQQEAYIIVINAYNNYDITKEISFNFYLKSTLFRSLFQFTTRKINKDMRFLDSNGQNSNTGIFQQDVDINDFIYNMDLSESVKKNLKIQEQLIFKCLMAGLTQMEISQQFKISQSKISRLLKALQIKLTDIFKSDKHLTEMQTGL